MVKKGTEIINTRNKYFICESFKEYNDMWHQGKGLMFTFFPKNIVFKFKKPRQVSLHMFFVFFPIDVLFLDENYVVVDMKEDFRPYTTYKSKKQCIYVVEVMTGAILLSKVKIGDKLKFIYEE